MYLRLLEIGKVAFKKINFREDLNKPNVDT